MNKKIELFLKIKETPIMSEMKISIDNKRSKFNEFHSIPSPIGMSRPSQVVLLPYPLSSLKSDFY